MQLAYVILRAGDITTVNWLNLGPVTMSIGGTATFEDTDATIPGMPRGWKLTQSVYMTNLDASCAQPRQLTANP